MFKKIILAGLLVISALIITACGSSAETTTGTLYDTTAFSIQAPRNWEIITDFQSNQPKETVVAFRNNVKTKNFIANITITKNPLSSVLTSTDYEKVITAELKKQLINFTEVSTENLKISIGGQDTDTTLVTFTAKQKADSDTLQFMQIYGVKENSGYIVTASAGTDEDTSVTDALTQALKSFNIK